jgi:hypothetical protein
MIEIFFGADIKAISIYKPLLAVCGNSNLRFFYAYSHRKSPHQGNLSALNIFQYQRLLLMT